MDQSNPISLDSRIEKQYDVLPYPHHPVEMPATQSSDVLFVDNFITSYYLRNQQVADLQGRSILDVGCGSGYKALNLAKANPGATIVGIDLSKASIQFAHQRADYNQLTNAEFHVLSIYDLEQLGQKFDYVNCDEVLYLLPDLIQALKAMKSVLKPDGILRTNLHSYYQRGTYFRAQKVFQMMGLTESAPEEFEAGIVIETMNALKDTVNLKRLTWNPPNQNIKEPDSLERVLMNYLLVGDRGFTIPEMFSMLDEADLEFISMVEWRKWELLSLFKNPNDLPAAWDMGLMEASPAERLALFELLNPVNRLIDFWCGHPDQGRTVNAIEDWDDQAWQTAIATLHPQLQTAEFRDGLLQSVQHHQPFQINQYLKLTAPEGKFFLDSKLTTACLMPLLDGSQSVAALVDRYQSLYPLDPVTLEPTTDEQAWTEVKTFLQQQETFMYVLLERS